MTQYAVCLDTPPGSGRTVGTISTYLNNNAVFNVMDFGATGNGTTDDTAAVQATINAASVNPGLQGGCVYLPPGVYKTTSALSVPQLVSVVGTSPEVTEIQPNNCNGFTFPVSGGAGPVKFGGFLIYGVGTISASIGINIPGDTTITGKVSGVEFFDLQINGFLTGIFARSAWYCAFRHLQIRNCWNAFTVNGLSVGLEIEDVRGILGTATGSGNSVGLSVDRDTTGYTAGAQVPQGIHVRGGGFNSFAIGHNHGYALWCTYTDMDCDLSTLYGVQQLSNAGGVTWDKCWFGIVGSGAGNGFQQQAIAGRDSGFTTIKDCTFVNTSVNVGCNGFNGANQQSNLTIEGCVFTGWTNIDIVVPNGGVHNRIVRNRCASTSTSFSIYENGSGTDFICYGNETAKTNHSIITATQLISSQVTLGNGAAAQTATLTNGPTAGNPTKWIPINDNGTVRYLPSW